MIRSGKGTFPVASLSASAFAEASTFALASYGGQDGGQDAAPRGSGSSKERRAGNKKRGRKAKRERQRLHHENTKRERKHGKDL
jgi:hypothetical protein